MTHQQSPQPFDGRGRRARRRLRRVRPQDAPEQVRVVRMPVPDGPGIRGRRMVRTRTMGGIVGLTLAGSAGVVPQVDLLAAAAPVEVDEDSGDAQPLPSAARRDPSDEIARDPTRSWAADARADDPATTQDGTSEDTTSDAWHDDPVAVFEDVELVRVAEDVRVVGFHEAAREGAVPLTPRQDVDAAHGRHAVTTDPDDDHAEGVTTLVLPTRGRAQPAASAVDIAVDADTEVASPVSGTVLTVDPYLLYGEFPDTRIVVRPEGRPDLRVVILHVSDALVAPGDEIVAGATPLADRATALPFESQVDRFTADHHGTPTPHVHVEIRSD